MNKDVVSSFSYIVWAGIIISDAVNDSVFSQFIVRFLLLEGTSIIQFPLESGVENTIVTLSFSSVKVKSESEYALF